MFAILPAGLARLHDPEPGAALRTERFFGEPVISIIGFFNLDLFISKIGFFKMNNLDLFISKIRFFEMNNLDLFISKIGFFEMNNLDLFISKIGFLK